MVGFETLLWNDIVSNIAPERLDFTAILDNDKVLKPRSGVTRFQNIDLG